MNPAPVLFVDLDGTFTTTDLLAESVIELIKHKPLRALTLPWLLKDGRAAMKRRLAERVVPPTADLPLRPEVLELIARRRAEGAQIVLATAQDLIVARQVADRYGPFDAVLGSDGTVNLKSKRKLEAMRAYCREHGFDRFDYVGDHRADLPIWREAARAYAVEPSAAVQRTLTAEVAGAEVIVPRRNRLPVWIRALRVHQWAKNALVFLPLLLAHDVLSAGGWLAAVRAFFAFSAVASAIYIVNDLFDLPADRKHPTKRRRPFASGRLPVAAGLPAALGCLAGGFAIAFSLPLTFAAALAIYLVANVLYTFWLKRKPILDVLLLGGMYTLRIMAGGLAVEVVVSEWLRAFSLFFFTSLAFLKRFIELKRLETGGERRLAGRGYHSGDSVPIQSFGTACGYLSVLVLSLYITGDKVRTLYRQPDLLWLLCPLFIYWISRVWMLAQRGELDEDPVLFALKDRASWIVLGAMGLIVWAAT